MCYCLILKIICTYYHCYRLNVLCPPDIDILKLHCQCDGI